MRTPKRLNILRSAFITATLGCLVLASGCAGLQQSSNTGGSGGVPGGVIPTPASATVSICDSGNSQCQSAAPTYSLASAPDLNVAVNWTNVTAGNHSQEIRLLMPNGDVYQRFQDSFFVPAGTSNGTANVSRFVPLRGTFITQRQIAGGWKLEVSLDGKVTTTGDLHLNP